MWRNTMDKKYYKGEIARHKQERLEDPLYLANPRWEEKPKKVWDYTTCKKYIKMMHLSKL